MPHITWQNELRFEVGRRSDAIALYQKRKAEARAGIKLPSNLRQHPITISELGEEAKQWYKGARMRRVYRASVKTLDGFRPALP